MPLYVILATVDSLVQSDSDASSVMEISFSVNLISKKKTPDIPLPRYTYPFKSQENSRKERVGG